jgi:hypothetical protein
VSAPPEYVPHRTETQRISDDIATAMRNLRRDWPHMLPRGGNVVAPGWESNTGVRLDDHDPRESDTRRIDRIMSQRRFAQDQLNGWCRVVMEDRPIRNPSTLPLGTNVPDMATFLERHAEWMSGHEAAQDCRDELVEQAHACHLIASPPRRESMSIGTCPLEQPDAEGNATQCGGDVRCRLNEDDRDGEAYAACNRCGEVAVASWWESNMFDDPETRRWLTDADVVTLIHRIYGEVVQQATVRQWVKRGVLVPSSLTTTDGRRLFDRDAVVYAIDLHKRRATLRA